MSVDLTPVLLDPEKYTWVHTDEDIAHYETWKLWVHDNDTGNWVIRKHGSYTSIVYPDKTVLSQSQEFLTLEEAQRWVEAMLVCT